MEYKSSFDNLLSVNMTCRLMCFGGWSIDVGATKSEYQEELDQFMDDFEFKTQKNSDIAKRLIKLIEEKKVVVKRQMTEEEHKIRSSKVADFFKNNPNPSEYELQKQGEFEWQCFFDWKTALLPIAEGNFDK